MKTFLILALLVAAAGQAHAVTFYPGRDACLTDSSLKTVFNPVAPPAHLASIVDPFTGTKITRIGGNPGTPIAGVGPDTARWSIRSRPHYVHAPSYTADETHLILLQDTYANAPTWLILDSLFAVKYTSKSGSNYLAQLDSMDAHPIPHPTIDSLLFGWIADAGGVVQNKLILFSYLTGITHKHWVLPVGWAAVNGSTAKNDSSRWGFNGETTVSDSGRFIAISSAYKRCTRASSCGTACSNLASTPDSVVIIDTMHGNGGMGTIGPAVPLGMYPSTWATDYCGEIDYVMISPLGNYVVIKYQGTPQHARVMHRGTSLASIDTSSFWLRPEPMSPHGLRAKDAATDPTAADSGWIAPQDHMDLALTTSGVEVAVGALRNISYDSDHNLAVVRDGYGGWSETSSAGGAQRDSGRVVMIELATGLHRHISAGRLTTGIPGSSTYEADQQHISARAHKMRGWAMVVYDHIPSGQAQYRGELVWWKLDGDFASALPSNSCMRLGHVRTDDQGGDKEYEREAHPSPSPTGRFVVFGSNWMEEATATGGTSLTDVRAYVMDARTTGTKTYWTDDSGDTLNTGFSASHPTRGFAKLNRLANANNGSNVVVNVMPGTHTDFPNPIYTPLGGKQYSFIGNLADPGTTTIASGGTAKLTQTYVSIKGVRINADLDIEQPARFDSILSCITTNAVRIDGADDVTIANSDLQGQTFHVQRKTRAQVGQARMMRLGLHTNTMTNLRSTDVASGLMFGSAGTTDRKFIDSMTVRGNVIRVQNLQPTGGSALVRLSQVRNSTFRGNRITLDNSSNGVGGTLANHAWVMQDSTFNVAFDADTFLSTSAAGPHKFDWARPGQAPQTVWSISIDSTLFRTKNGAPIVFSTGADRASITYTTAIADGNVNAMSIPQIRGAFTADHNTFVSDKEHAAVVDAGVVNFGQFAFVGIAGTDTAKFTNNLVASNAPGAQGPFTSDRTHAVYYDLQNQDSLTTPIDKARERLRSDWNAYSIFTYVTTPGDRSIGYQRSDEPNLGSVPGSGSAWEVLMPAKDSLSVYGSAQFDDGGPDSVWAVGDSLLNPQPGLRSIVKARGKSGTDIGAVAVVAKPQLMVSRQFFLKVRGAHELGIADTSYVTFTNLGSATLTINSITEDDDDLTATFPSAMQVTAGQSKNLVLIFNPTTITGRTIEVTVTTNDPRYPTVTIEIRYNQGGGGTGQDIPLDG